MVLQDNTHSVHQDSPVGIPFPDGLSVSLLDDLAFTANVFDKDKQRVQRQCSDSLAAILGAGVYVASNDTDAPLPEKPVSPAPEKPLTPDTQPSPEKSVPPIPDVAADSWVGTKYKNADGSFRQEDSSWFSPDHRVSVVADGMGGMGSGDVASQIVCDVMKKRYESFPHNGNEREVQSWLDDSLRAADFAIKWAALHSNGKYTTSDGVTLKTTPGMAATVVASAQCGDKMLISWAGDSRAYRLRDGKLEQLTEDHTPPGAPSHIVSSALGIPDPVIDHAVVDIKPGDRFLLASDGLETLKEPDISKILGDGEPKLASKGLIDAVKSTAERLDQERKAKDPAAKFRQDNVSVLVVDPSPRSTAAAKQDDAHGFADLDKDNMPDLKDPDRDARERHSQTEVEEQRFQKALQEFKERFPEGKVSTMNLEQLSKLKDEYEDKAKTDPAYEPIARALSARVRNYDSPAERDMHQLRSALLDGDFDELGKIISSRARSPDDMDKMLSEVKRYAELCKLNADYHVWTLPDGKPTFRLTLLKKGEDGTFDEGVQIRPERFSVALSKGIWTDRYHNPDFLSVDAYYDVQIGPTKTTFSSSADTTWTKGVFDRIRKSAQTGLNETTQAAIEAVATPDPTERDVLDSIRELQLLQEEGSKDRIADSRYADRQSAQIKALQDKINYDFGLDKIKLPVDPAEPIPKTDAQKVGQDETKDDGARPVTDLTVPTGKIVDVGVSVSPDGKVSVHPIIAAEAPIETVGRFTREETSALVSRKNELLLELLGDKQLTKAQQDELGAELNRIQKVLEEPALQQKVIDGLQHKGRVRGPKGFEFKELHEELGDIELAP